MESSNGHGQPYTWFVPERDDESGSTIPRRDYDGWVRVTRWDGNVTVVKVKTVRFFGWTQAEMVYPQRPKEYPLFDNLFARAQCDCIPEEEALAWLTKHKLPLPAMREDEASHEEAARHGVTGTEASEDAAHVG